MVPWCRSVVLTLRQWRGRMKKSAGNAGLWYHCTSRDGQPCSAPPTWSPSSLSELCLKHHHMNPFNCVCLYMGSYKGTEGGITLQKFGWVTLQWVLICHLNRTGQYLGKLALQTGCQSNVPGPLRGGQKEKLISFQGIITCILPVSLTFELLTLRIWRVPLCPILHDCIVNII